MRAVGTSSSTCVSTLAVMDCFSRRNSHSSTSREVNAPSSTPQKMPGRPCIQKKSKKFISAKPPSRMLVVSPTSVAAPCRLEDTAMAMITGTGEIFSLRAMARPTGATMSTVATLSTNALMTPAKSASTHTAHWALGTRTISCSARRERKIIHAQLSQCHEHRRAAQGHPRALFGQCQHEQIGDSKNDQCKDHTLSSAA